MYKRYPRDLILDSVKYCEYNYNFMNFTANKIDSKTVKCILNKLGFCDTEIEFVERIYSSNNSIKQIAKEYNFSEENSYSILRNIKKKIGSLAFSFLYLKYENGVLNYKFEKEDLIIVPIELGYLNYDDLYTNRITNYKDMITVYTIGNLADYYLSHKLFAKTFNRDKDIRTRIYNFLLNQEIITKQDEFTFRNQREFNKHYKYFS